MSQRVPVRLEKDTILEAVFELRFHGTVSSVTEVLQGALYPTFKNRFPTILRTQFANIPPELLEVNPTLRYQPRLQFQGDNLSIFIGDHQVVLSNPKPYLGWAKFRPLITELMQQVQHAGVNAVPERLSLKYINLLEAKSLAEQFSMVKYKANVGRYQLTDFATYTKSEFEERGLTNIVELSANTTLTSQKGEVAHGLMVTVDTVFKNPPDLWNNLIPHVEKVHDMEKSIFFEILTDETTKKLGAVWS